jgi:hypothetical protein
MRRLEYAMWLRERDDALYRSTMKYKVQLQLGEMNLNVTGSHTGPSLVVHVCWCGTFVDQGLRLCWPVTVRWNANKAPAWKQAVKRLAIKYGAVNLDEVLRHFLLRCLRHQRVDNTVNDLQVPDWAKRGCPIAVNNFGKYHGVPGVILSEPNPGDRKVTSSSDFD